MEVLKKYFFLGVLFISFTGNSQTFYKRFTTLTPFNSGNGITQLPDSTYAITGSSGGLNAESGQAFLMIIDTAGNHIWTKNYGGSGDDIGVRVIHLPNKGFFIAGYSNSTENGDFDFVVYRTDENGELLWEKNYGTPNWERLRDAQLLPDGGLILVGQTEGSTTDGIDMFMVRIDKDGEKIWSKTISSPKDDIIYVVDTLANSKILVGGDLGNENDTLKGTLLYFDYDGNLLTKVICDEDPDAKIRDFTFFEGKLYVVGGIHNEAETRFGIWYSKREIDGTYIAHRTDSYSGFVEHTSVALRDQYSLFLGLRGNAPDIYPYPEGNDALVTVFGIAMEYQRSSVNISGRGDDIINQMIITNDGSLALVGTVSDQKEITSFGSHIVVVKLAPDDSYLIDPDEGASLVQIKNEKEFDFSIYPNPTKDKINITSSFYGKNFFVKDVNGKTILQGKLENSLDFQGFNNGIYFLSVEWNQQWNTFKILKQ